MLKCNVFVTLAGGTLPAMDAMMHGIAIAQGLEELHTQRVIHKDLKPDNILLMENGFLVLADFGIAATMASSMSSLHPFQLEGTMHYMAPEQLDGDTPIGGVTTKSDIWALGCTLLHMLTGQPPFNGKSLPQIAMTVGFSYMVGEWHLQVNQQTR